MTSSKPIDSAKPERKDILRRRFHELRKLASTVNAGSDALLNLVTTKCLAENDHLAYLYGPCRKAVEEIAEILKDSDATLGYHLNRVGSGTEVIDVYEEDEENNTSKLLGTCTTDEEAEALMNASEKNCYTVYYDPDEWWAILDTKERTVGGVMYAAQNDAYVAMLTLAKNKVPAWNEYNRLLDEHGTKVPFWGGPKFIHEDEQKEEV